MEDEGFDFFIQNPDVDYYARILEMPSVIRDPKVLYKFVRLSCYVCNSKEHSAMPNFLDVEESLKIGSDDVMMTGKSLLEVLVIEKVDSTIVSVCGLFQDKASNEKKKVTVIGNGLHVSGISSVENVHSKVTLHDEEVIKNRGCCLYW